MHLTEIALRDFRNYASLLLPLRAGVNVFMGQNAQGKTNVLEAVYLCCLGKSHRTVRDAELIRQGQRNAYCGLSLSRPDGPRKVEVLLAQNERKRIQVSGVPIKRMAELMGHVQCILFSPEDLLLIKGGPSLRRRYMDASLCQLRPSYFLSLARYNTALTQRNALLKRARPNEDISALLDAFDITLSICGAEVIAHRQDFLRALAPICAAVHHDISGGETLTLQYRCRPLELQDGLQATLLTALQKSRADDLRRMTTLCGPHRDDLILNIDGKDARIFGSQGQQRTAALALKMASAEQMQNETGQLPILMLDDVFSELDEYRQQALIARIRGQALITTATVVPRRLHAEQVFTVRSGHVTPQP